MTIQEQLDQARSALHKLRIGKAVVSIKSGDGKELSYSQANIADLKAYIQELEDKIGAGVRRRAIGVRF